MAEDYDCATWDCEGCGSWVHMFGVAEPPAHQFCMTCLHVQETITGSFADMIVFLQAIHGKLLSRDQLREPFNKVQPKDTPWLKMQRAPNEV